MRIRVETVPGPAGIDMPSRMHFDGRDIDIAATLDRWPGSGYCYFKVTDADGHLYILRCDETGGAWDLTMFQRAGPAGLPADKSAPGSASTSQPDQDAS